LTTSGSSSPSTGKTIRRVEEFLASSEQKLRDLRCDVEDVDKSAKGLYHDIWHLQNVLKAQGYCPIEDSSLCTYKKWFAGHEARNARSLLDLALSMRCMQHFRMGCPETLDAGFMSQD
jgi:hypothetical protein